MVNGGAVVVVGGTRAIGLEIGKHFAARGDDVVLTGQDPANVAAAVDEARGLGRGRVDGVTFDLSAPETIAPALAGVGTVRHLVLAAIDRDANSIKDYDIGRAIRLATLKLVGYSEVVHTLLDRLRLRRPERAVADDAGVDRVDPTRTQLLHERSGEADDAAVHGADGRRARIRTLLGHAPEEHER